MKFTPEFIQQQREIYGNAPTNVRMMAGVGGCDLVGCYGHHEETDEYEFGQYAEFRYAADAKYAHEALSNYPDALAEIERTRWHKYPAEEPPSDEVLEAITDAGTILVLGFEEYWFLADDEYTDEIQRNVIYWRYWTTPPSDAREDYLEGLSNGLLPEPPEEE